MVTWAVFDVDGTLLPAGSMERLFLPHALRTGAIPVRNVLRYLASSARGDRGLDGFKTNKMFLGDLPVPAVEECAQRLFRARIAPMLSEKGLKSVEECRGRGHAVMLMTGAPDFLARHMAALVGCDHIVCAVPEVREGRYTGRLQGLHPYGERKREILLALRERLRIDFPRSVVFANHHTDVSHMELFGRPVAVNPTVRLRIIAWRRGWRVERWN